ncbi:hypothetical protein [Sporosarcina sp. FSL W7-1283]|uniref:hypothetical protein n=1 Tax=Sporosarcina sp. FSL W7-1283 TaxID=2921560 RepID=UPI0030F69911
MVRVYSNPVLSDAELIWALQQENALLRSEMTFYADKKTYEGQRGKYSGVRKMTLIETDKGARARKVLGETE